MVWLKRCFLSSVLFMGACAHQKPLQKIKVQNQTLNVLVATTFEERQKGLMHRKFWGRVEGMLFVFPKEERRAFWMKDTHLPLSVGFFGKNKKLKEIQFLHPEQIPIDRVVSEKKAKYVLEVPKGWFSKNKVEKGASLEVLE